MTVSARQQQKSGASNRFRRLVGRLGAAMVLIVLLPSLSGCSDEYPDDWPSKKGMFTARKGGSCPDLEGDYTNVSSDLLVLFGVGSSSDRWRDHHARITQADDGSWLRIELGLNAKGMQAATGTTAKGQPGFGGLGRSTTLKEDAQYYCRNGWLYSYAWDHGGDETMGTEYLRFGKDRGGGLIAGGVVTMAQSLRWGDSPSIPLGQGKFARWYRWDARDPGDEAAVARLERVHLQRASWVNPGGHVPTYFSNFTTKPICARLVQVWRIAGQSPVITRGNTTTSSDDAGKPYGCPQDSGTMGTITTTIWQVDVPDPDSVLGDYRVEWQRVDRLAQPWNVVPIADVRDLPVHHY